MKREISILAIFIGLVAFAMVFSGCGKKTVEPTSQSDASQSQETMEQKEEENIGKPWVEVVMDGAYIVLSEEEKIALKSGDELNEGEIIETDKSGLANVYFPDGSVARMDGNTKIQITTGQYDYNSKSLKVRISLMAGNVWSKIIKLATPESVWEVKTSNAVAAVRGSAFGTSHMERKTTIIGSEHNIAVSPINPANSSIISNQQALVGERQVLIISHENISGYVSGNDNINGGVKTAADSLYQAKWIASSLQADNIINERLSELQSQGMSEEQARLIFGQELVKKFNPRPRQGSAVISTQTDNKPEDINSNLPTQKKPEPVSTDSQTTGAEETSEEQVLPGDSNNELLDEEQPVSTTTASEDDTWADIPVATGTSPNLGDYFIEETSVN